MTKRLDKGLIDFGILIQPANLSKYHHINIPAKQVGMKRFVIVSTIDVHRRDKWLERATYYSVPNITRISG